MVALWMAAMADILSQRYRGTFTGARLLHMAAAVSIAAVVAVAVIGADFAGQQSVSRTGFQADARGKEVSGRAYIFSFGLEHVTNATSAKPKSTS